MLTGIRIASSVLAMYGAFRHYSAIAPLGARRRPSVSSQAGQVGLDRDAVSVSPCSGESALDDSFSLARREQRSPKNMDGAMAS